MTDKEKEIVQALRICATHIEKGCGLCPQMKYVRCTERLADEAITMIERLTAENAALREKVPLTEDTMINLAAQALGVEPSRLRELAEADKDKRVVVLPCKVGDTVYILNRILGTDNTVYDRICARKIRGYGGNALNKVWLFASGDSYDLSIFPSEFGKTVFLSREEAEKDLQEME